VIVSGVLDSFSRKEFEEFITSHGGVVSKSITKKLTHLVNDHGEVYIHMCMNAFCARILCFFTYVYNGTNLA
jgi:hypothetical protein